MTVEELVERDARLLEETRLAALEHPGDLPRNPAWGDDYDPLSIVTNPRSFPQHTEIALVNLRIAMHPEEHWGKCANCGRVYHVSEETPSDTVCSDECFHDYSHYLAADVGVSFNCSRCKSA